MKSIVKYLSIIVLLLSSISLYAQHLEMSAVSDSLGTVYLRWAPTTPSYWRLCNRHGYRLERYTIPTDGLLSDAKQQLLSALIQPAPEAEWETICQTDAYAPVLAQALYGENFEVEMGKPNSVSAIIAISEQYEQRFAFSLMSADLSFPAAQLAGLGYIDRSAKAGERYFYRIRSLIPPAADTNALQADSVGTLITAGAPTPLPFIQNLMLEQGVNCLHLSWNENPYHESYVGYWLERSADGKTFMRLNKTIIVNTAFEEKKVFNRIYFTDSVPDNETAYHYRICGQTIFGLCSPPSNVVKGRSKPDFPYQIQITSCYLDDNENLVMRWNLDLQANKLLKNVLLKRAKKDAGPYHLLLTIAPDKRELLYEKSLEGSNYVALQFVTIAGDTIFTPPFLIQANDTIPPMAPQGLVAEIDTLGIVRLSWRQNSEEDFLGYRVFRAMHAKEGWTPITSMIWYDTLYVDTLNLKLNNPVVRYTVAAFDVRHNPSPYSQEVTVTIPLKIPPAKAAFLSRRIDDDVLTFSWSKGSQQGLKQYLFRQKNREEGVWIAIEDSSHTKESPPWRQIEAGKYEYVEQPLEGASLYLYQIKLENSAGICSYSDSLIVPTGNITSKRLANIDRFYGAYEVEKNAIALFWTTKIADIDQYQLYRAANDEPLTLWQLLPADQKAVYDHRVELNSTYHYAIIAVMKSGMFSQMKRITIKN